MIIDEYFEEEMMDDLMIDIISDIYLEDFRKYLYFKEDEKLYELYTLLTE